MTNRIKLNNLKTEPIERGKLAHKYGASNDSKEKIRLCLECPFAKCRGECERLKGIGQ